MANSGSDYNEVIAYNQKRMNIKLTKEEAEYYIRRDFRNRYDIMDEDNFTVEITDVPVYIPNVDTLCDTDVFDIVTRAKRSEKIETIKAVRQWFSDKGHPVGLAFAKQLVELHKTFAYEPPQ